MADSSERQTSLSRRDFVKAVGTTAAGAAAVAAGGLAASQEASAPERPGPDDTIRFGWIGCGGRGSGLMGVVLNLKEQGHKVDIVAVCDIYRPRLAAAAERTGGKPYDDHRELLADPNVDAVCVATPDHHHAPQAIDAMEAGKDVYCEKPLTHWRQLALAKALAQTASRTRRVLQLGTQTMADGIWPQAAQLVKDGAIGKPIHAQTGYFRCGDWGERMPVPDPNAQPGPDLNWKAFLGDSPRRPFSVSRFFQWRMYWDYAGGPATDLFPHPYTPIHQILGVTFPSSVSASGGKLHYNGDREVPDTFNMLIDYPEGVSVTLMCTLANAEGIAPIIRGTEATLTFGGPGIILKPASGQGEMQEIPRAPGGDVAEHWLNFLACIRSGEPPYSDAERGYQVQTAMNMGILSLRERKLVRFDAEHERIVL